MPFKLFWVSVINDTYVNAKNYAITLFRIRKIITIRKEHTFQTAP